MKIILLALSVLFLAVIGALFIVAVIIDVIRHEDGPDDGGIERE